MSSPNIIFIVLDTLRYDKVLSTYKNIKLTPFIESLLKDSFYFENSISNSPWTLPSHISMFTGLYPTQSALISKQIDVISNRTPILAEILKDLGYFTICFSENAFISKAYGLVRGFDKVFNVWDWNPWIREKYTLSTFIKLLSKINNYLHQKIKLKFVLNLWTHFKNRSERIIKTLIKILFFKNILFYLKNNTILDLEEFGKDLLELPKEHSPYFIFFNLLTVHDPYIPLIETFKNFSITINDFKQIRDIIINPLKSRLDINIKSKKLSEKQIATLKKLYSACVYSGDVILKKLFFILENCGLLDNSYVIITSDHGEHLGDKLDHYFWEHNTYQSVYKSLLRVPLIIFNKNLEKKNIKNQVQLKDLFHTILHMTGIPVNKNKYLNIHNSLLYQVENNVTPKYIFGEYLKPNNVMLDLINSHRRTINLKLLKKIFNQIYFLRTNTSKYIKYDAINVEEFYNLEKDPNEIIEDFNKQDKEYNNLKAKMEDYFEIIQNIEEIKELVTKKEKESVKKVISRIKIQGI